jgi:N-acetylglucosamine-6-phosphate deacetylase
MMNGDYYLCNAKLVLPRDIMEGSLLVRTGRIEGIFRKGEEAGIPADVQRIDAGGAYVTPGLFELHIHGAGGVGFDSLGESPLEGAISLARARAFLRDRGVTTFLPTLVPSERAIGALAEAIEEAAFDPAELPGIYVEGPFIAAGKRGGIPLEMLRAPDEASLERLLGLAKGRLRLMTFAPELEGAKRIEAELVAAGVLPCLGHSEASLDAVCLPQGRFSITHLFNAMSAFSHKQGEEGLAMLPFIDKRPFVELNPDGVHVNASALKASARALDPDKLILISDAMVAAGLAPGEYNYCGKKIVSGKNGVRYADTGLLMGSNRLAPELLRNWLRVTGAGIPAAVAALSLNPARLLGIEDRRGSIEEGKDGVLVIWRGEFEEVTRVLG